MMEEHQDSVYRKTIFHALDFAWHHKRLWFLGIFAGLVNSGGVFEVLFRGLKDVMSVDFNWGMVADAIAPGASLLFFIPDMISGNALSPTGAAALWFITVSFILLGFWFFSLAQGALLAAVESPGDASIAKRTHDELPLVGRLVKANLITHLALAAILLLTFYPYASALGNMGQAAAAAVGFLIATPLTMFVTIFSIIAICGIALRRQSLKAALKNAWLIIKTQPFFLAESAFILFAISVLFVFLLGITLRVLTWVWGAWSLATFFVSAGSLVGLLNTLFLILTMLAILAGFGFLVTFQYAAWAALYDRLSVGPVRAAFYRYILIPLRSRINRS